VNGVCQYSSAEAMFKTLIILKRNGYDSTKIISFGAMNNAYPKKITRFDLQLAQMMLSCDIVTNMREILEDDNEEAKPDSLRYAQKLMRIESDVISNQFDMDSHFKIMRNCSDDLWTAASKACKHAFKTDFSHICEDNHLTGLQCFMLVEHGFVKNPKCFSGFDT
jgi:hypothetical protein